MSDQREPPHPPDLGDPAPLHITELTPPPPPPPLADEAPSDPDQPPDVAPPPPGPVVDPPASADPGGWPAAAKVAVAILAVLAIAGVIGTIVGFSRASSAEDDASASSQDVAAALERAQDAEQELATAEAEAAQQAAQQAAELAGERDAAVTRAEEAEAAAELLEQSLVGQEGENEQLTADLAASEETVADLEARVGEIDELFPVPIDTDLAALDLGGPYTVTLTEVSCVGLDLCGSPPQLGASTLSTEGGGLRLVVPDRLNIPLVAVGGSLFGVADEQALVPPCGDVPRDPALTMGLFGDAGALDEDGDLTLSSLAGSVLIDVQPVGDCPVGRVWYRAQLDRAG